MKQQSIAIVLVTLPTLALCFSPTLQHHASSSSSALSYRDYDGIHLYDDVVERTAILPQRTKSTTSKHKAKKNSINSIQSKINYDSHLFDVESDRTSLRTLLDPPAAPFVPIQKKELLQTPEERARALRSSSSRVTRATPTSITSLYNIQDYQEQILNSSGNEYELSIIRFKAPWCQTCRTTNLAWERMASRLSKASSQSSKNKVKFYQVELDGKEESTALKDFLEIEGVPQGVMHIPNLGIDEQKVKLHRKNLTQLKKNLDRFLTVVSRTPTGDDGLQGGMLLDGLREEE